MFAKEHLIKIRTSAVLSFIDPPNEQKETFRKGLILFLSSAVLLYELLIAKNANRNVRQLHQSDTF